MTSLTQYSSKDSTEEIRDLWQNTTQDVRYIAYKHGLAEQTVRNMVRGLKGPPKVRRTLSQLHRVLGLMTIDKRTSTKYTKQGFAQSHGMSHIKLSDIEKGFHDFTITEIIQLGLFDELTSLEPALLGND